jgi:hypothetical protein
MIGNRNYWKAVPRSLGRVGLFKRIVAISYAVTTNEDAGPGYDFPSFAFWLSAE